MSSWLYTRFLSTDAKFRLRLKDRNRIKTDTPLAPGWGYYITRLTRPGLYDLSGFWYQLSIADWNAAQMPQQYIRLESV